MTTHAHPLTPHFDTAWWLRQCLAILLALTIILGAAWLALSPSTVTEIEGTVSQKWLERSEGKTNLYWVEISTSSRRLRCSLAEYQTQLIGEWDHLETGQRATMTCYGGSAVQLNAPR